MLLAGSISIRLSVCQYVCSAPSPPPHSRHASHPIVLSPPPLLVYERRLMHLDRVQRALLPFFSLLLLTTKKTCFESKPSSSHSFLLIFFFPPPPFVLVLVPHCLILISFAGHSNSEQSVNIFWRKTSFAKIS